jgi:hypothetical protein
VPGLLQSFADSIADGVDACAWFDYGGRGLGWLWFGNGLRRWLDGWRLLGSVLRFSWSRDLSRRSK